MFNHLGKGKFCNRLFSGFLVRMLHCTAASYCCILMYTVHWSKPSGYSVKIEVVENAHVAILQILSRGFLRDKRNQPNRATGDSLFPSRGKVVHRLVFSHDFL